MAFLPGLDEKSALDFGGDDIFLELEEELLLEKKTTAKSRLNTRLSLQKVDDPFSAMHDTLCYTTLKRVLMSPIVFCKLIIFLLLVLFMYLLAIFVKERRSNTEPHSRGRRFVKYAIGRLMRALLLAVFGLFHIPVCGVGHPSKKCAYVCNRASILDEVLLFAVTGAVPFYHESLKDKVICGRILEAIGTVWFGDRGTASNGRSALRQYMDRFYYDGSEAKLPPVQIFPQRTVSNRRALSAFSSGVFRHILLLDACDKSSAVPSKRVTSVQPVAILAQNCNTDMAILPPNVANDFGLEILKLWQLSCEVVNFLRISFCEVKSPPMIQSKKKGADNSELVLLTSAKALPRDAYMRYALSVQHTIGWQLGAESTLYCEGDARLWAMARRIGLNREIVKKILVHECYSLFYMTTFQTMKLAHFFKLSQKVEAKMQTGERMTQRMFMYVVNGSFVRDFLKVTESSSQKPTDTSFSINAPWIYDKMSTLFDRPSSDVGFVEFLVFIGICMAGANARATQHLAHVCEEKEEKEEEETDEKTESAKKKKAKFSIVSHRNLHPSVKYDAIILFFLICDTDADGFVSYGDVVSFVRHVSPNNEENAKTATALFGSSYELYPLKQFEQRLVDGGSDLGLDMLFECLWLFVSNVIGLDLFDTRPLLLK